MNSGPNHEAMQEMLAGAALDTLDGTELERVLAHARACEECAGLLEEYRAVTAGLAIQLPPRELDAERSRALKARLLTRAARNSPAKASRAASIGTRWGGWLVAASLAGVLLVHHSIHRTLDYGWLAAGVLTVLLVAIGVYAGVQRSRAAALQDRLATMERQPKPGGESRGP